MLTSRRHNLGLLSLALKVITARVSPGAGSVDNDVARRRGCRLQRLCVENTPLASPSSRRFRGQTQILHRRARVASFGMTASWPR